MLEPGYRFTSSQYPAAHLIPGASGTEPPTRPKPVETLHVQHPGHTSDLERDFNSRKRPGG